MKRRRVSIPPKATLTILTALSILLMILSFTTDLIPDLLGNIAGYTFQPFKEGLTEVSTYIGTRAENMRQVRDVLSENSALRAQIDELSQENDQLVEDRFELMELRDLFELNEEYKGYDKIGARIIGKDPGNWYSVFVIDKGKNDGIKEGMNVIAGAGLVGIVTKTGDTWAQVRSIIDDDSNVSGRMLNTSDNLIVYGSLESMENGTIEFGQLSDPDDEVNVGDKIVTSNISDRYLPGIAIGFISSIKKDPNNLTKSGTLTPSVDFEHIDVVLVITQMKEEPGLP
ncbi:MAG TPA: rod shape-determining protein MreC [Lachnospiraceae bacterium]|nr:rod shape-determining protein MreC [Lachnospiraceae bacterium]HAL32370.1 rod shape-determining protein MreC [Lachnospiraceae bacterium]HCR99354.1 rod shape-determining protein MreC [Lachnospiraceae bacterium]